MTNDLQAEKPSIFGPHGGSSRIFSITEVTFNMGTMLGPLLSGALVELFGFYTMVGAFGQCCYIGNVKQMLTSFFSGIICLAVALASFVFLSR